MYLVFFIVYNKVEFFLDFFLQFLQSSVHVYILQHENLNMIDGGLWCNQCLSPLKL